MSPVRPQIHSRTQFRNSLLVRSSNRLIPRFEMLERRLLLSASSIDGRPYVDIGPSDNVAWDQPRVTVQFLTDNFPDGTDPPQNIIVGPNTFSTWLLDTGANTTLVFQTAVTDMREFDPKYETDGLFEEIGVGGTSFFDISIPYRFDFSGNIDFERNTLQDVSVISRATSDISIFGPWGITGMPAMTERITTLDFTPWTTLEDFDLFMQTGFSEDVPEPAGPRYTISVDNRISFDAEHGLVEGDNLPMWADLPFFTTELKNNENLAAGNFLFDTGAQVSIISSRLAFDLGLDSNSDGLLNELDANFARQETVGGIGGTTTVPVFLIDEAHVQTDQGSDLVWTDLQWLVLDIVEGIDGVFGFDNMTSGWIEAFGVDGQSGYLMQSHLDFRGWEANGVGKIHFDVNPDLHTRVDPNGPGAVVDELGGITSVSESGINDTYQIKLSTQPTENVTVTFVGSTAQAVAYDAANPSNDFVVFTPANWNVPQTVVVAAINDSIQEGYHRVFIRNLSSSADPNYDGVGMPRISVSVTDDDFASVMIIPTDGETIVTEDGLVDYYDIVLMTAPAQDVSIFLEHVANQVTAVNNVNGSDSLLFTPANWDIPQRVRVEAIDDLLNEGPHPAFITHRISTSDENYLQAFVLQERVAIIDNDDDEAPHVANVILGATGWSAPFIDLIDGGGSEAGNGRGIDLLAQSTTLPWTGLNRIYVQFSEFVNNVSTSTIELRDSNGLVPYSLSYDPQTFLATLTLSSALDFSKLRLALSDDIVDINLNALDGDASGTPGGTFNFRLDIVPGDSNGDGRVNGSDLTMFSASFNAQPDQTNFAPRANWNGDGRVNGSDLSVFSTHFNFRLDSLSEPGAPFGSGGGASSSHFGNELNPSFLSSVWLDAPFLSWNSQPTATPWQPEDVRPINPLLEAALRRRDNILQLRNDSLNQDVERQPIPPIAAPPLEKIEASFARRPHVDPQLIDEALVQLDDVSSLILAPPTAIIEVRRPIRTEIADQEPTEAFDRFLLSSWVDDLLVKNQRLATKR